MWKLINCIRLPMSNIVFFLPVTVKKEVSWFIAPKSVTIVRRVKNKKRVHGKP